MASLCKNLRLARHGANYINHRLGVMRLLSASTFCSNRPILTPPKPKQGVNSQSARLAPRAFHNFAMTSSATGDDTEPIWDLRKTPPAHYLVKMDLFSLLNKLGIDKYETGEFEAGGYKWKLTIYPNGHGNEKDDNYVSASLAVADKSSLPANWEVNAVYSICLLVPNSEYYRSFLGRTRFHATKADSGISKFITWDELRRIYPNDDRCVFGAEVFVNENNMVTEYVSLKNYKFPPYKRDFMISNFHVPKHGWDSHKTWTSEVFIAGGQNWELKVCPNGWEESTGRLSIFLEHVASDYHKRAHVASDHDKLRKNVKASYTICLKSKFSNEHNVKYTCPEKCFPGSGGDIWGWRSFIDFATLNDPDKGFIYDACVRLELELSVELSVEAV